MPLYSEDHGILTAEDAEIPAFVSHVDVEPEVARALFDLGVNVGDWGWKHKVWKVRTRAQLAAVRAAARYFYSWDDESERITVLPGGLIEYEAWYAAN